MIKISLKDWLSCKDFFSPEMNLDIIPYYILLEIYTFLNRNEKMILDMTLQNYKFRDISEDELLYAQKEEESYLKEEEQKYSLYFDDDFNLFDC